MAIVNKQNQTTNPFFTPFETQSPNPFFTTEPKLPEGLDQTTEKGQKIADITRQYLRREVNLPKMLLGVADISHQAHTTKLTYFADHIEKLSNATLDANNLLTEIESTDQETLNWSGDDAKLDEKRSLLKKIIGESAKDCGVTVPQELLDLELTNEKFELNKEQLEKVKKVCNSIVQQAGKLEQQDQLKLNQAQTEYNNITKMFVNLLDSLMKLIEHIIQRFTRG